MTLVQVGILDIIHTCRYVSEIYKKTMKITAFLSEYD